MGDQILERLTDLLTREKKAFAQLALSLANGTPHVSPIWFDYEEGLIILNTARGRVKDKVLHRRGVVAMSISDPTDPYRYVLIKGPVVAETEENAYDRICDLNLKYKGERTYPKIPGQVRVTYTVKPEHFFPDK